MTQQLTNTKRSQEKRSSKTLYTYMQQGIYFTILFFLASAVVLVGAGLSEEISSVDVIVIPGNAVSSSGEPSERLKARLDRGCELYLTGKSKFIIVSGGTGWQKVDEAQAMRSYLISKGVPQEKIIADSSGYNTWATAHFTAAWMKEHQADSVLVVSQYFHVPRTALALERFGIEKAGKAYARFFEWGDMYSIAREVPAWILYLLRPVDMVSDSSTSQ